MPATQPGRQKIERSKRKFLQCCQRDLREAMPTLEMYACIRHLVARNPDWWKQLDEDENILFNYRGCIRYIIGSIKFLFRRHRRRGEKHIFFLFFVNDPSGTL